MFQIKDFEVPKLIFDNTKRETSLVDVIVQGKSVSIPFENIINSQFSEGNTSMIEKDELKQYLSLGKYSKAPCGGFVNFYRINESLYTDYVIYSGVNEVSNAHYIVTVHKVLRVEINS
jgi:hypothetical protein